MRIALPLVLTITAAASSAARADSSADTTIVLNQAGQDLAADLGIDVPALEQKISDGVEAALGVSAVGDFLKSFSNATSFSNRGVGVDYASNSERAIIGIAGNVSLATDLDGDLPAIGAALNLTLMAGLNLRRWNHPELTVYANTFYRGAESDNLHGSIVSVGGHLQYKMFTPTQGWKNLLVQWGGIDFTSGLELAHWGFGLRGDISTDFDVTNDAGDMTTTITAATGGRIDLSSTTVTVPVEVTTNARLLYILSAYTGFGLDFQAGSSKLDLGVSGSLTGTRPGMTTPETIGSIEISGEGSHGPSLAGWHALLGLQANIWRAKLFLQTTFSLDTFSLALGTRVVL